MRRQLGAGVASMGSSEGCKPSGGCTTMIRCVVAENKDMQRSCVYCER